MASHPKTVRNMLLAVSVALLGVPAFASAGDKAAAKAAANGSACASAQPFYWEIGDTGGVIVSGQVGTLYDRDTRMNLASASKWPFGAYVLERYNGVPSGTVEDDLIRDALRMLTGYKSFNQLLCTLSPKVSSCFNWAGNHTQDPAAVGVFYYSGGNDQYAAADEDLLGLGNYTTAQLNAEVQGTLGITLDYQYPAIAGGMEGSAGEYAEFLKKLMKAPEDGGLVMHDYLGLYGVDTQPCPSGLSGCSPGGTVPWHYSFNYWIEDSATSGELPNGTTVAPGDGAYSSPGAYGFYPWITADVSSYGLVARRSLLGTAYQVSLVCGQAIRYAYEGYTPPAG